MVILGGVRIQYDMIPTAQCDTFSHQTNSGGDVSVFVLKMAQS